MPMTRPGVGHVPIPHSHPHRCAIHRHLSVETAIAAHRGGADAGAWDELPVGPVVGALLTLRPWIHQPGAGGLNSLLLSPYLRQCLGLWGILREGSPFRVFDALALLFSGLHLSDSFQTLGLPSLDLLR